MRMPNSMLMMILLAFVRACPLGGMDTAVIGFSDNF
jgi:hypothetical protein